MRGSPARPEERSERSDREPVSAGFEAFFREHYPVIVRLAQRVVGDFQTAQDVAQDVLLSAYRRFPDDYGQAAGWVRVAAAHMALNQLRGERRRDRSQLLLRGVGWLPSAEEAVLDRESRAEVRHALARLPRRSAAALVLRHSGMSYAEIANSLGVKAGQVGTLLRRAESALGKEMTRATPK